MITREQYRKSCAKAFGKMVRQRCRSLRDLLVAEGVSKRTASDIANAVIEESLNRIAAANFRGPR